MNKTYQNKLVEAYLNIKRFVIESGFGSEIDWQDGVDFSQISESDFLREFAWVALSSGMSESVIRQKFSKVSEAFLNWKSAIDIIYNREECVRVALKSFNHKPKISSIVSVATSIALDGFDTFKYHISEEGINFIKSLPYMGPRTSYHLAKNIGFDVVKPDRHLVRIAEAVGLKDPERLCRVISKSIGDRLSVIDIVLWRYATLDRNYLEPFLPLKSNNIHSIKTSRKDLAMN